MKDFSHFLNQIPNQIRADVETYIGSNIILFRPCTYITNVKAQIIDYHFVLPSSNTPPTVINNKIIEFSKNRLIAINPGTTLFCDESRPTTKYYAFSIKPEFVTEIAKQMGFPGEVVFSRLENPCSNYLKQTIYNLEQEIKFFTVGCSLMYESLAVQVTALLIREADNRTLPYSLDNGKHFIETAIDYMSTFYYCNIKIDDICREIYVTPYHFIRVFKEKMGMTPHEYLLNIRIEKAKHLLESGECSITDAAKLCGFISISHFSYVFSKKMGISPSEYRKKYFILGEKR